LIGALALVAFALFVVFAFTVNQASVSGYTLYAKYNHIDGLPLHADVRIAGIRVGEVATESLAADNQALVAMVIEPGMVIPSDSAAVIASDGLFGGKFIKIVPGGDATVLKHGGSFDYVQDSVDFEHILQRIVQEAEAKRGAGGSSGAGN
jgi:phospholipid/cholesterol/gamma-HCH transport system substrate-binding protein